MRRVLFSWRPLIILAILLTSWGGLAQAQGATYTCDAHFYQIRQPGATGGSNLFLLDRNNLGGGGTAQWGALSAVALNALAYNKGDGFFYAVNVNPFGTGTPYRLYRLGTTGAAEVANLTNITNTSTIAAGTIDSTGKMYIKKLATDSTIYTVQLPTSSGGAIGALGTLTLNTAIPMADMAFDPVTNQLYAVYTANIPASDGATASGVVYQINPSTGVVTPKGAGPAVSATNAIGTAFFDISGTLYAYQNGGTFGTINLSTGVFTRITAASSASQSDGASCVFPDERISAGKVAGSVQAISPTVFRVPYSVTVTNTGSIPDRNVQLTEDLNRTFSSGTPTLSLSTAPALTSGTATLNAGFNGTTDTRLLSGLNTLAVGATLTVTFTVQVTYPNLASVPASAVTNVVYATSSSTGPNAGYTFPGGTPLPPIDLLATASNTPTPVTLVGQVDLGIGKTGPATAVAGTAITYTLTLSNAGPSSANGATFSDPVPASLTGVTASCLNPSTGVSGCSVTVGAGNALSGSVSTFPSGGSVQVQITGTIPPGATTSLTNQATITAPGGTTETAAGNNTSPVVTTALTKTADLAIDQSGPAAVGSARSVSYIVRVWNNGPSTVNAVPVIETLSSNLTVTGLSCAPSGSATCGPQSFTASSVTITTGSLPADTTPTNAVPDGNFLTYTITGTAPTNGLLSNAAQLTVPGGVTDGVSINNTAPPVQTRVVDAVNDATVTLPFGSGGTVTVLGGDTNGGVTATAANSVVTVVDADGITGLSVNGSGQLVVPAATPAKTSYTVTYRLCDSSVPTACDDATVSITVAAATTPDLALSKSGPLFAKPSTLATTNPAVPAYDSLISYVLTVTTTKSNATGTTTVTDTLPAGFSWTATGNVSATPGSWSCAISGQVITCTTASTVTVGTPQTITLANVRVPTGATAAPTFTNMAAVSNPAESGADAAAGNTATFTTRLVLSTLTKEVRNVTTDLRDNAGTARFGTVSSGLPKEVLEYCIDVKNLGGADLQDYVLTDDLDVQGTALTAVATDAAYGGKAIKWTRVTPGTPATTTTGNLTAATGDDAGSLNTGLTYTTGTLLAGETVRACFQTRIR